MKQYAYIALASITCLYAEPKELRNTKYLLVIVSPDPEDNNPQNSRLYRLSKHGLISIYCLRDTVPVTDWHPKHPIFLTQDYRLFNKAQESSTRLEQNDRVQIPAESTFTWSDDGETVVGKFPCGTIAAWNAHTGKLQAVD